MAVVVFATTNVDDILLLSAFFADQSLRGRAIVIGQFAGIGLLTAVSAVAALLALAVPEGWTGLLGLFPLGLGLRGLYLLWASSGNNNVSDIDIPQTTAVDKHGTHSQWIAVALVTVANGGDNLGVYIPLFSRELTWIPVYAIVFAIMTGLWCMIGHWLVHHEVIGVRLRQYGHVALPFVLVGIGLFIVSEMRLLL